MKKFFYDNIVVGSGISALGIIHGLIKNNKKIVVIDPLIDLSEFNNGNSKTIFCDEKLPLPYYNASKWKTLDHFKLMSQKIFGGHTNFWGGNSMRIYKNSIEDWPIKFEEIEKYYDYSEKVLNVQHYNDEISNLFNIKKRFRKKIDKNKMLKYKKNDEYIFGKSRISRKFSSLIDDKEQILNVKDLFIKLKNENKIKFIKGELIKFLKKKNKYQLILRNNKNNIFCKRLFIATGALNTKKIVYSSIKTNKKILKIKQSQGFLVPAILKKDLLINKKNASLSDFHLIFKRFFKKNLYLEIKYCPELIKETFRERYGLLYYIIPKIIFKRIVILWGFIPSEYSFNYRMRNNKILISKENINKKIKIKNELIKRFNLINKNFSIHILKFFLKFTQFGRGYHIGGCFPMTNNFFKKKNLVTNSKGNLNIKKYKNLFIIDNSILTSIPSCSLGLTLFANALRISSKIK